MSQIETEMQEIEVTIGELKKAVVRGEALRRLMKNKDFKTIIEDEYFREEAVRLTSLLGSPIPTIHAAQEFIVKDLEGIAALRRFFSTVLSMSSQSEDQILSHENELEDLREEYATVQADAGEQG